MSEPTDMVEERAGLVAFGDRARKFGFKFGDPRLVHMLLYLHHGSGNRAPSLYRRMDGNRLGNRSANLARKVKRRITSQTFYILRVPHGPKTTRSLQYEIDSELHGRAKAAASLLHITLKEFVERALEEKAAEVLAVEAEKAQKAKKRR